MSLRAIGALVRAAWLQARSYRMSLVMQFGGLVLSVVPTFFIANALQDTMADTISAESSQYFAFIVVGTVAVMFCTTALNALHGSISGGISSGYFETLLMTRASLWSLLAGLTGYGFLQTVVRGLFLIVAAWVLGVGVAWGRGLEALVVLMLLSLAHWGLGLISAAMVVAFRTAGPLSRIVMTASMLFGGVYYPTSAIPSWLGTISEITPLAYGLRPLRRMLLQGESIGAVQGDVAVLALIAAGSLALGWWSLQMGLRYARRSGSLGAY